MMYGFNRLRSIFQVPVFVFFYRIAIHARKALVCPFNIPLAVNKNHRIVGKLGYEGQLFKLRMVCMFIVLGHHGIRFFVKFKENFQVLTRLHLNHKTSNIQACSQQCFFFDSKVTNINEICTKFN